MIQWHNNVFNVQDNHYFKDIIDLIYIQLYMMHLVDLYLCTISLNLTMTIQVKNSL